MGTPTPILKGEYMQVNEARDTGKVEKVKHSGPIADQLDSMELAINMLGESINMALTTFTPVLGKETPENDTGTKGTAEPSDLSDLADNLRVKTRRIKELYMTLTNISGRCQL